MLGEKLKEYRKKKGWKQEELAERSGYSRSSIINWETGKRAPRTVDIERIALTLGVSPHDLIGESLDASEDDSPITLQNIPHAKKSNGYAYWGGVLDEAQRVAAGRNLKEISLIMPLLKLAYETLASAQEKGQVETGSRTPSVSAYNGDHSNYTGNTLMVEPA